MVLGIDSKIGLIVVALLLLVGDYRSAKADNPAPPATPSTLTPPAPPTTPPVTGAAPSPTAEAPNTAPTQTQTPTSSKKANELEKTHGPGALGFGKSPNANNLSIQESDQLYYKDGPNIGKPCVENDPEVAAQKCASRIEGVYKKKESLASCNTETSEKNPQSENDKAKEDMKKDPEFGYKEGMSRQQIITAGNNSVRRVPPNSPESTPQQIKLIDYYSMKYGCAIDLSDSKNTAAMRATGCGKGAMGLLAKGWRDKGCPSPSGGGCERASRNDFVQWASKGEGSKLKSQIEDDYNCEATESALDIVAASATFLNMGMQAAAGAVAGVAVAKTQTAFSGLGTASSASTAAGAQVGGTGSTTADTSSAAAMVNVQKEALRSSADMYKGTAAIQTAGAASHSILATVGFWISTKAGNRATALQKTMDDDGEVRSNDKMTSTSGVTSAGLAAMAASGKTLDADDANSKGAGDAGEVIKTQKALSQKALGLAMQSTMQVAALSGQAATNFMTAKMLNKEADELAAPPSTELDPNAIIAATPSSGVDNPITPTSLVNPTAIGSESSALATDVTSANKVDPLKLGGPLFGGGGNAGGMRDGALPSSGGIVAPGTTSGGSGGLSGGGGGGSGGGSAANNDSAGDKTDTISGGPSKFEGTGSGGGGGTFAAVGGPAAKAHDTGMDFNSLLGALMPKKDEEGRSPAGSILDFDGKHGGGVIGGGGRDDSFLGPSGESLFTRASNRAVDFYKRGNLK